MKVKIKTKVDTKPFRKLIKDVNNTSVKVGYINSPKHWYSEDLSVADLAAILHFDSLWGKDWGGDGFMLDNTKKQQVFEILKENQHWLDTVPIREILNLIGDEAAKAITFNIMSTSNPPNSEEWADRKGFNDPLVYGGRTGDEPNLLSEITHKVGKKI